SGLTLSLCRHPPACHLPAYKTPLSGSLPLCLSCCASRNLFVVVNPLSCRSHRLPGPRVHPFVVHCTHTPRRLRRRRPLLVPPNTNTPTRGGAQTRQNQEY